ncbi:hypothetical protein EJB05_27620, partial [Eragrostis curvula]
MAAAAAGGGGDDRRREGPWWLEWEKKQKEEGKEIPAQAEDELVPDPKSVVRESFSAISWQENKNYQYTRGTTGDNVIDQELKKLVDAFNEIGVSNGKAFVWEDQRSILGTHPVVLLCFVSAIAYEKLGKGSEEAKKKKH